MLYTIWKIIKNRYKNPQNIRRNVNRKGWR